MTKRCFRCGQVKNVEFFHRSKRNKDGRASYCKECDAKRKPIWQSRNVERHKEAMRNWQYRHLYGISLEEYNCLYKMQGGRCAICGSPPPDGRFKHFAVDHDHTVGKVRGLLCTACNRGLGLFCDNPVTLELAAQYLRNSF